MNKEALVQPATDTMLLRGPCFVFVFVWLIRLWVIHRRGETQPLNSEMEIQI